MRRVSFVAVMITAWIATAAGPCAQEEPRHFALLVGCTRYPNLEGRDLRGPANDVELLAGVLRTHLDLPAANITSLAGWPDSPDRRPTRVNILAALDRLAQTVRKGDRVTILLAGHGSRQPDLGGDELDGLDEIFLPADAANWTADKQSVENAIVDDELGVKVGAIRDAGARVWLIVDSCFSGTMLRAAADEVRPRFLPPDALGIPPAKVGVRGGDADARGAVGLRDTRDIVAMYASRSYHTAPEMKLPRSADDRRWQGVLSFLIARHLTRTGGATTFAELYQQIVAAYPALPWHGTLPLAEGHLADQIRGGAAHRGPILHVSQAANGLTISGGALQDLRRGTVLAVYRPGQRGDADGLLGHVEIDRVALTQAHGVAVTRGEHRLPTLAGELRSCPAEVAETSVASNRLRVAITDASGRELTELPADIAQCLGKHAARLERAGLDDADLRVAISTDSAALEVMRAGTHRDYRVARARLPRTLLQVHRVDNLRRLATSDTSSTDLRGVEVELHDLDSGRPIGPGDTLRPGSAVELRVRNRAAQERGVWVFLLDADFGIVELFPRGLSSILAPGDAGEPLKFTATDSTLGTEHMLVLVVPPQSAGLGWLAEPPLKRPTTRSSVERGGIDEVLEELTFGTTRGFRARRQRGDETRVQLVSWQTSWGEVAPPAQWPTAPIALPQSRAAAPVSTDPDPWRRCASISALRTPEAQAGADVLIGGGDHPHTLWLDLDGDAELAATDAATLRAVVSARSFDAELALQFDSGRRTAFYDTDNDGVFDLALVDEDDDPQADVQFTLVGDRWQRAAVKRTWLRVANVRGLSQLAEERALRAVRAALR